MPTWEKIDCQSDSANQGYGRCVLDYGQLDYMIAVPKGTVVTAAELADFENTVRTKSQLDSPALRWYLMGQFPNYTAANTAPQTQTASSQRQRYTSVGFFGWTLGQWDGGNCAYKNLLKMHQQQDRFDFLNIHGGQVVAGKVATDVNGNPGMGALRFQQVFVPNWEMADGGSNGTKYEITFLLGDSNQMRALYTGMKFDFDIQSAMAGIIDVQLINSISSGSTGSGADFDIQAIAGCGGTDLADLYATELADVDAWIATNAVTGAEIEILDVSLVNGYFRVALDDANANYPDAGGSIKINLRSLSVLDGLGVVGYESPVPVTVIAD